MSYELLGSNSEEWKWKRRQKISGTDIGKLMGVSRFGGPLDVWKSKMGLAPPFESGEAVEWGVRLEHEVAKKYHQKHGVWLTDGIYVEKDWKCGTPDFLLYGQRKGLEIKTAGYSQLAKYKAGEVPPEYVYQCRWYMHLMDYDEWDLAVLVGGQRYFDFTIKRDLDIECDILTKCESFYVNHVVAKVPPESLK